MDKTVSSRDLFEEYEAFVVSLKKSPSEIIDDHIMCGSLHNAVDLSHAMLGLQGEVGELADAVKRYVVRGEQLDTENIAEELGDAMYFMQMIAFKCELLFSDVMRLNQEKLRRRFPNGYTDVDAARKVDHDQA